MEQALYISKTGHLKYWNSDFTRLYFGMEFCELLLPSPSRLSKALDFTGKNHLSFTLVTPYLTERGLKRVERLIDLVSGLQPASEIVFNDWGVFHLVREKGYPLKPVLGRLLNKMKRGPRIFQVQELIPKTSFDYFVTPGVSIPAIQEFLLASNISRVEFDNLLQGLNLGGIRGDLHLSLYLPFAYVTTTRFCLSSSSASHDEMKIGIAPCKRACQHHAFSLFNPVMTTPLIRKGNTIFFKNEALPEKPIRERRIDRLVVQPELPL